MAAVLPRIQATPANAIATLYRGAFGKVEFLRCNGARAFSARHEVAARLHFTLPLVGSFVWHADRDEVFADPTTLLCTHAGESFWMSHPHGGDESLVLTPNDHVLSQLSGRVEMSGLKGRRRTLLAPAHAQLIAYTFYVDPTTTHDRFAADECMLRFFESAASGDAPVRRMREDSLVGKALDYVHHTPESLLTLKSIAAALEVRAAHLTHAFARHTGQPLYRYVLSLKLSRALHRIATSDADLTEIALDLGFSSHSHLSAVFKKRYGASPSEVRHRLGRSRAARAMQEATERISVPQDARVSWRPLCVARGGCL